MAGGDGYWVIFGEGSTLTYGVPMPVHERLIESRGGLRGVLHALVGWGEGERLAVVL